MSVLHSYFDYDCDQSSPVIDDFVRVVNYDSDGNEIITYEKFDYRSYQSSLGDSNMWSIDSLLKAGISPNFPIHTSFGTRLQGVNTIEQAMAFADSLVSESDSNK